MQRRRRYIGDIGVLLPSSSQNSSSIPSSRAESKDILTVNNPGVIIEDDEFPDETADTNKMLDGIMQSLESHPTLLSDLIVTQPFNSQSIYIVNGKTLKQ